MRVFFAFHPVAAIDFDVIANGIQGRAVSNDVIVKLWPPAELQTLFAA
jgi:hypothetical protein